MIPEVQTYIDRLRDRRAQVLKTIAGLDEGALDWSPLPGQANSLAVLAIHLLGAERNWLHGVVGQRKIERDRDAEFRAGAQDVSSLEPMYEAAAGTSEQILAELTGADLEAPRRVGSNTHSVRWSILHVLEHYNEHLGQMQLTRQLYENRRSAKIE